MRRAAVCRLGGIVARVLAVVIAGSAFNVHAGEDDEPPLTPPEPGGAAADGKGAGGLRQTLNQAGITGSLRAGYWSSDRRLDDKNNIGTASAWLKLDKKLENGIGLFGEGYLANEDIFGDKIDTSRLREAYVEGRRGQFDFRVGKQIIAWGRADRFNPTDNLTPRDFTLLAPDVDEDRFGSLAAKGSWNFDAYTSLTGIWLYKFSPNVFAAPSNPTVIAQESVPQSHRSFAIKLDQSGKTVDWSLSYFDGYDLNPDISSGGMASGGQQVIALQHHRLRVFGADAATTQGSYRFAAEAAYYRTEDPDGTNAAIKNPFFYGVFGVERDYADNFTVIVQAFTRNVFNYSNPESIADPAARAIAVQQAVASSQYDRTQQGLVIRLDKKWFNETLEAELAAAAILNRDGYLIRPRIIYLWTDSLKLIGGYEWYGGSDKTVYGALSKNKTLFAEIRWYF